MKIKKKVILALIVLWVCLTINVSTFALSKAPRLVDGADLLSSTEQSELLSKLNEISERQKCDIVIVTTYSLNGKSLEAYADDFYDYNAYGFNEKRDGLLLLISLENKDWYISTCGYATTAVNDDGIKYISKQFLSKLSAGKYYLAFNTFASLCDDFVNQAKTGKAYGGNYMPKAPFNAMMRLILSMTIGIVVALIVTNSMKAKLKSVHKQVAAVSYAKSNSMHINESRDIFLYNTVERNAKSTSSSSSGRSSTHNSSSNQIHGGSGGKF